MIKKYEGCRLEAYLCPANVWTIGYGHTGADVYKGKKITEPAAAALLADDLKRFEKAVLQTGLPLSQNQFDGLVSFTYNCGAGNLKKLIKGRNHAQIAEAMLLYTKAAGRELPGLVKRRQEERALFLSEPVKNLGVGAKGDRVKWLQTELNKHKYNLKVDGIFGVRTLAAVVDFQDRNGLVADGIVGRLTRGKLCGE